MSKQTERNKFIYQTVRNLIGPRIIITQKQVRWELMKELKLNGCAICGYKKHHVALDFHHVNPKYKNFQINTMFDFTISDKKIAEEINKCILLCANCHRIVECSGKVEL